jgi:hypothetical protein
MPNHDQAGEPCRANHGNRPHPAGERPFATPAPKAHAPVSPAPILLPSRQGPRLSGGPAAGVARPRVPARGIGQSPQARQKPMHLYRRLESHHRPDSASAGPAAPPAGAAKPPVPACGIGQSLRARQKPMHLYRGPEPRRRPGRAPGRPKGALRPIGRHPCAVRSNGSRVSAERKMPGSDGQTRLATPYLHPLSPTDR